MTDTLHTRPPTGLVPYPLVMLEGEEKAGKSWSIAEFSASPKVGRTLWLDLGEGAGDEYGAIDGARYELIVHDGRWSTIMSQIRAARDVAQAAKDAGELPVVLAIDSVTAEWDMHKDWADTKARRRDKNMKLLDKNPDAEIQITSDLWNLANARHKEMMLILKTFPGIVILTAQGAEVTVMDKAGNPTKDKAWKVDAQKRTAFDCSVWVRLMRAEQPRIIGARSVHVGIVPGEDKPKIVPGLTLEKLVFDILKCDPKTAQVRDLKSGTTVGELVDIADAVTTKGAAGEAWKLAYEEEMLDEVGADGVTIRQRILDRVSALQAAPEPPAAELPAAELTEADEIRASILQSISFNKKTTLDEVVKKFAADHDRDYNKSEDLDALRDILPHVRGIK